MRITRPRPLLTAEERQAISAPRLFAEGPNFVKQVERVFAQAFKQLAPLVSEPTGKDQDMLDMVAPGPDGQIVRFGCLEVAEGAEAEFKRDLVRLLWACDGLLAELRRKRPDASKVASLAAEFGGCMVAASARRHFETGLKIVRGGAKAGRIKAEECGDLKGLLIDYAADLRKADPKISERAIIAEFAKELKTRGEPGRSLRTYQAWLKGNRAAKQ